MAITDLLTQIEIAPGRPGPLSDNGMAQRVGNKPQPKTDYRDKLARSLNDAPQTPADKGASGTSHEADSQTPSRDVAPGENKSELKNTNRAAAPERSENSPASEVPATSSRQPQATTIDKSSSGTPVNANTAAAAKEETTETEATSTIDVDIEIPTAEEISNAAIAILTVTTSVPTNITPDIDTPATPLGLYQLLQAEPVQTDQKSEYSFATNLDNEPLPPSGLLDAIRPSEIPSNDRQLAEQSNKATPVSSAESVAQVFHASQPAELESIVVATNPIVNSTNVVTEETPTTDFATTTLQTNLETFEAGIATQVQTSDGDDKRTSAPSLQPSSQTILPKALNTSGTGAARRTDAPAVPQTANKPTSSAPETDVVVLSPSPTLNGAETQTALKQPETVQNDDIPTTGASREHAVVLDSDATKHDGRITKKTADVPVKDASDDNGGAPLVTVHHTDTPSTAHTGKLTGPAVKVDPQGLVDQVSNSIQFANESGKALRVRLHPPELGILQIEISSKDGMLTARLETQTASAHHAIVENLSSLREALAHVGSHVDRIEVQVAENRGSDNLQQHANQQDDDTQQQNPRQNRRQNDPQQQQDDEIEAVVSTTPNSIDQLDIQI